MILLNVQSPSRQHSLSRLPPNQMQEALQMKYLPISMGAAAPPSLCGLILRRILSGTGVLLFSFGVAQLAMK